MKLTEREFLMLKLVLEKLALSEGAVELDHASKKMKYVKPITSPQSPETRRNHAKLVLRLLGMKLAANGIKFGRVTTRGRSNKGQYDFDTKSDRAKAKKLFEEASVAFAK
jgi:hypothetical protein